MGRARTIKKVALVTPPYHCGMAETAGTWMPLSLGYLAASLRSAGCEVVIYDAMSKFHTHAQIEATLADLEPDAVGTGAITSSFPDCVEVLRTAKRLNPDTLTLIGGVHPTLMWEETLRTCGDAVDVVVRHEGEETLPELVAALAAGGDLSGVQGIAYLRDGAPFATPARPRIADLDALPVAWDLFEWTSYTYRPEPGSVLGMISTSRGCTFACSFCSQQKLWERTWRARTPESLVAELEHLSGTYGLTVAMLTDETPTISRPRWERFLDLLVERDLGVQLYLETRADDILRDRDLLGRYKQAGIAHVYVGSESVHQRELDTFSKGLKVEQAQEAIGLLNDLDIITETSFVLGMPDETPERIQATVARAMEFNSDLAFFLAIAPFPYADLYPQLEPYVETKDYRQYNLSDPVIKPRAMTREAVKKAIDDAHQAFFMNKFKTLGAASPYKRKFMLSAFKLLMEHSYFGEKMRAMADRIPASVWKGLEDGSAGDGCPVH